MNTIRINDQFVTTAATGTLLVFATDVFCGRSRGRQAVKNLVKAAITGIALAAIEQTFGRAATLGGYIGALTQRAFKSKYYDEQTDAEYRIIFTLAGAILGLLAGVLAGRRF